MFRSNVNVGRGCIARKVAKPTSPAAIRADHRFATPQQVAAYRQSLIDKGIIGKPVAASQAA